MAVLSCVWQHRPLMGGLCMYCPAFQQTSSEAETAAQYSHRAEVTHILVKSDLFTRIEQ